MKTDWDPSDPIESLFTQISDAAEFTIYAEHTIADNDKVQAAEVLILKTGVYGQDYKE